MSCCKKGVYVRVKQNEIAKMTLLVLQVISKFGSHFNLVKMIAKMFIFYHLIIQKEQQQQNQQERH